ncbi:hypothetical protein JTB14_009069 [Gonioctena quinquepunctata]|nr:hypothetical protein JTB14_009069 [Gonioctena quinquepunctata]
MELSKNILIVILFIYSSEAFYQRRQIPVDTSYNNNDNDKNNTFELFSTDDFYDDLQVYPGGDGLLESRIKKSQTTCRVKKIQRTHSEDGAEFFPKQYNEYECVPFDGDILDGNAHNIGTCKVRRGLCAGIQKYQYYMKKSRGDLCWSLEKRIVNAGCDCITPLLHG